MDLELTHQEISETEWLSRMKKIESNTVTPWARVANNITYSLQWIGKEVLHQPRRRYFGLINEEKIVCCVGIYFLSATVIRARGFYCEPQWRCKGYMKKCLEESIKHYSETAEKILVFSPQALEEFYRRLGFQPVAQWAPRPLEYFDHQKNQYVTAESIMILERWI